MGSSRITQEKIDNLIEDARYLQDEIEALQYVIEEIPYKKENPSEPSIAELLFKIDHAQKYYYKPMLQKVDKTRSDVVNMRRLDNYEESFEFDVEELDDIQPKLKKIIKHRASLVNAMRNIHLIDWEKQINTRNSHRTLFEIIENMVQNERGLLKKIADQVMLISKERQSKRDLNQKKNTNTSNKDI